MRAAAYIVTTSAQGSSKTQLWESNRPLTLGHPFQWMIERTPNGIRVRDLSLTRKGLQPAGTQELTTEAIFNSSGRGAELQIPVRGNQSLSLRIRPAQEIAPVFATESADKGALHLYECTGDWVRKSLPLTREYQARSGGVPAFRIRPQGGSLQLEPQAEGLKISVSRQPAREWKRGEALSFNAREAVTVEIYREHDVWRFGQAEAPAFTDSSKGEKAYDPAWILFQKSIRATAVALTAFLAISFLWPKPKEDPQELVPPQFAKIVMSQPKPASAGSAQAAGGVAKNEVAKDVESKVANAPKKVQEAAVVQAFRAKALSHAVSGLLKGGMTTLLAQSDFVSGAAASKNARSVFDSKSSALQATAPDAGMATATGKNVAVGAMGAGTGGVAGGVGYGKGDKAGVKGQGGAFVSLDAGNAAVDEGLTKDEVGEVIHRHMSEVRYCYESAMLRTPDIEGKLMTAFVIGPNGMVKSTEVKSSTLSDARLDDCILRRLVTWKFPNPRGGVDVAVSYPFIFKSLGR